MVVPNIEVLRRQPSRAIRELFRILPKHYISNPRFALEEQFGSGKNALALAQRGIGVVSVDPEGKNKTKFNVIHSKAQKHGISKDKFLLANSFEQAITKSGRDQFDITTSTEALYGSTYDERQTRIARLQELTRAQGYAAISGFVDLNLGPRRSDSKLLLAPDELRYSFENQPEWKIAYYREGLVDIAQGSAIRQLPCAIIVAQKTNA